MGEWEEAFPACPIPDGEGEGVAKPSLKGPIAGAVASLAIHGAVLFALLAIPPAPSIPPKALEIRFVEKAAFPNKSAPSVMSAKKREARRNQDAHRRDGLRAQPEKHWEAIPNAQESMTLPRAVPEEVPVKEKKAAMPAMPEPSRAEAPGFPIPGRGEATDRVKKTKPPAGREEGSMASAGSGPSVPAPAGGGRSEKMGGPAGPGGSSSGKGGDASVVETTFGANDAPSFMHREMPIYPRVARRMEKTGKVVLMLFIDETGKVLGIDVIESAAYGFTEAAIEAVKKSTFVPARRNGQKVSSRASLTVRFNLE